MLVLGIIISFPRTRLRLTTTFWGDSYPIRRVLDLDIWGGEGFLLKMASCDLLDYVLSFALLQSDSVYCHTFHQILTICHWSLTNVPVLLKWAESGALRAFMAFSRSNQSNYTVRWKPWQSSTSQLETMFDEPECYFLLTKLTSFWGWTGGGWHRAKRLTFTPAVNTAYVL